MAPDSGWSGKWEMKQKRQCHARTSGHVARALESRFRGNDTAPHILNDAPLSPPVSD
jgi:hypothetical protein